MNLFIRKLTMLIDAIGYCCAILMILMLLNVFIDVVMRYLFNSVSIGLQELEWHLFSAMFMFGIGYTLKENGHVRVDIFFERMSARAKALIDILGAVIFIFPFSFLILYNGFEYAKDAYAMNEASGDPGGLPYRWVIRAVIPVSSLFLMLCALQVIFVQAQKFVSGARNTEQ